MKKIICILACISFALWAALRIGNGVDFEQKCGGYLKLAGDANTIELAERYLAIAVKHCEDQDLTKGYTSVFYKTPDENIAFWYINLKASLDDLRSTPADAPQLVVSNVLMKLRETLLDGGDGKASVTCPDGISIYPNNKAFFAWGLISLIVAIIAGIGLWRDSDYW